MKTIKSFEVLEKAGIFIRDFEWENDTVKYLEFISGRRWETKDDFLYQFERQLAWNRYPISCLKNIVHIEGTTADGIAEIQKYAKKNLIDSYNHEKDIQLKFKIAQGLGNISSIHYFFIALRDPDLSDQQRNEVWKKIIDRWQEEPSDDHKSIDISHYRDALKVRDESERT